MSIDLSALSTPETLPLVIGVDLGGTQIRATVHIVQAQLGNDVRLIGAETLVYTNIGKRSEKS